MFQEFKEKRILVLGFGLEGQSTFRLIRKEFPRLKVGIADKADFEALGPEAKDALLEDGNFEGHFGPEYLKNFDRYDIVIKTPGISPFTPEIQEALAKGVVFTSQTQIFFDKVPKERIVGITGTKGKSTTTTLIYNILKGAGIKAALVGNIGNPALEALEKAESDQLFVYEMSSYMLEGLKKSPRVAVFLNLYEDHLDYHKAKENYREAKENIFRYQGNGDHLVINREFRDVLPEGFEAEVYEYSFKKGLKRGCYKDGGELFFTDGARKEPVVSIADVALKGEFNLGNAMAAIAVAKIFGVGNEPIRKALREFKALPHRIEFAGKCRGVVFYDDSISTIPQATVAAMQALGGDVETLILGGHDRGISFDVLTEAVAGANIRSVILFPDSGKRIWEAIAKGNPGLSHYFVEDMEEAVEIAVANTFPGKICLMSPGSPSFGLFKDYRDRGNALKAAVKKCGAGS